MFLGPSKADKTILENHLSLESGLSHRSLKQSGQTHVIETHLWNNCPQLEDDFSKALN